jgi:PAS domain S-box-containing protein
LTLLKIEARPAGPADDPISFTLPGKRREARRAAQDGLRGAPMRAKDHDRLDGTRTATDAASLGVRSIVVPYAALAALWIVLSDWLVSQLVADPHGIAAAGTVKGLLFVALTTVLLYALVRHFARAISAARSAAGTMTSAEALERIAVASPGAIGNLRMRPDGSVSFPFASRGIEDIYGVPAGRLARDATAAWAAIHPADTARLDEETRESARTLKPQHSEFRVLHPAKGEIWVSIHATPERTADGGTQWLGTANDITESKRVEEALRRSEERMRLAMGAAPLGTWDWDLASGTIDWSDNLWQMFGLERGSEALKIDAVLRTIHRDDRERVQQAIDRALAGDAASRIEMRFVKPDGSIRRALSHGRRGSGHHRDQGETGGARRGATAHRVAGGAGPHRAGGKARAAVA